METLIGEKVFHHKYGEGVIKYQQTRIGVKFENEEHIITFDYPKDFKTSLVAKSDKLIKALNGIPNWERCEYCGLYYEALSCNLYTNEYGDPNFSVCDKCRNDLFQCGLCHDWFFQPSVIRHCDGTGIPICNGCYLSEFTESSLKFPVSFSQLMEWGFSLDDLYEYIFLFDEIRSVAIYETLTSHQKNDKVINRQKITQFDSMIVAQLSERMESLLNNRLKLDTKPSVILAFLEYVFGLAKKKNNGSAFLYRYRFSVDRLLNDKEQKYSDFLDQHEKQLDVHLSLDKLREIFETQLYWYYIRNHRINAFTASFFEENSNIKGFILQGSDESIHILPFDDVVKKEKVYDSYLFNPRSELEKATKIFPSSYEEMLRRSETIDGILSFDFFDDNDEEQKSHNLFEARCYFEKMNPANIIFRPDNNILYLYRANNIKCKRFHKDRIISATALILTELTERVPINVEYCTQCSKFFMDYSSFEKYRNKYRFLIIKLQEIDQDGDFPVSFSASLKRKENSPLSLAGYNVNAINGLTSEERHELLTKIIQEGILSKIRVIEYLRFFILQGKNQKRMKNAVEKWKEDLEFVEFFLIDSQLSQEIDYYSKY